MLFWRQNNEIDSDAFWWQLLMHVHTQNTVPNVFFDLLVSLYWWMKRIQHNMKRIGIPNDIRLTTIAITITHCTAFVHLKIKQRKKRLVKICKWNCTELIVILKSCAEKCVHINFLLLHFGIFTIPTLIKFNPVRMNVFPRKRTNCRILMSGNIPRKPLTTYFCPNISRFFCLFSRPYYNKDK